MKGADHGGGARPGESTVTAPDDDVRRREVTVAAPLATTDRYQILAEHGRGGLGRVLRVHDRAMGRVVAIKELLRRDRTAEARFLREAFLTARLEHPGIVPVHEAGHWPDGTPFYSMKLVAGRPLRALIDGASLDQRLALLPHVVAVADAIAYAHARGVIHRDLKPGNVIVGDYGETVVIDWGLAKERGDDDAPAGASASGQPELTELGAVVGTPAYMAPEQARGAPGSEGSDVYALGAILYAVIAGHSPYHDSEAPDLVRAVADGPPPPLREIVPDAPSDLLAIVDAAMARDPALRLASAGAMADELRRYQRGQLVRSRRYSSAERALRWMRRHRELTAALAAAAAVIAVLGAIAIRRIVDERDLATGHQHRAEAALSDAAAQRDQLILTHARAAILSDPTEALLWLRAYRGPEHDAAQELAALADAAHAATFSRRLDTATIYVAAAVAFDRPRVLAFTGDGRLLDWGAGRAAPTVLADRVEIPVHLRQSPAGEVAFIAGGELRRVDPATGAVLTVDTLPGTVVSLGFSPDSAWLIAATDRGAITLQARGQPPLRLQLPPAAARISDATVGAGGAVAACDRAGHLWAWRPTAGWRTVAGCAAMGDEQLVFAPTGTLLATANGSVVRLIELATGEQRTLPTTVGATSVLRFPDADTLVLADQEGTVDAIDVRSGVRRHLLSAGVAVFSLAVHGDTIVVGYIDGTLIRVSRASGQSERIAGFPGTIVGLQFSPEGRRLLVADVHQIRILPLFPDQTWRTDQGAAFTAVYDDDDRWLAVAGQLGDVLVVDRAGPGRPLTHLRGHTRLVRDLVFAGDRLITGSWDGTVRAWQPIPDRWPSQVLLRGEAQLSRVFALDGGTRVLAVDDRGQAFEIATATGAARPRYRTTHPPRGMALAADQRQLASISRDGHLDLVDLTTDQVHTSQVHRGGSGVSIDPHGTFLATSGDDGLLRVQTRDGALLRATRGGEHCGPPVTSADRVVAVCDQRVLVVAPLVAPPGWALRRRMAADITALAFSRDGHRLAVGTSVGGLYLLDLVTGDLAASRIGAGRVTTVTFSHRDDELAVMTFSPILRTITPAALEMIPAQPSALRRWLAARIDTDAEPSTSAGAPPSP